VDAGRERTDGHSQGARVSELGGAAVGSVGTEGRQETASGEKGPQMSAGCREPRGWGGWAVAAAFPAGAWRMGGDCDRTASGIPEGPGTGSGAAPGVWHCPF
jgi:hypothetical protein